MGKTKNEEGMAVCETLIDKIEKSMPKPEPVFMPQMPMMWMQPGGGKGGGKGQGKSAEEQAYMVEMMRQQQAGSQVARKPREGGNQLDMLNLNEEIIAAKVKEVALAIIGDGEDMDLDTPLMEAGLTSSTAVVLK